MRQGLALLFYNVLLIFVALIDVLKWQWYLIKRLIRKVLARKTDKHDKREWRWGQKYGLVAWSLPYAELRGSCALVHCASVGEVVGITPLLKKLMQTRPELKLVVTTNTLTGKETLQRLLADEFNNKVYHVYFPIDLPWLMATLFRRLRPKVALIMEVELWPNFIRQCKKRNVPAIIVNGRLTDSTASGYRKLAWLFRPMIQSLSTVFVRNDTDKKNYLSLGLDEAKLHMLGNIKFDLPLPSLEQAKQMRASMALQDRLVILAGSTHFGEEELIIKMFKQAKQAHPELLLIIAPRHPERFEEVLEYILVQDLKVNQQSRNEGVQSYTDVLLIDEMGLLSELYGVADVAFVGGSIADRGGHNPIEPASFGIPTLMGPHIYNNPEICGVLSKSGGLKVVECESEFQHALNAWLDDQSTRLTAGKAGRETLEDHRGLVDAIADNVLLAIGE